MTGLAIFELKWTVKWSVGDIPYPNMKLRNENLLKQLCEKLTLIPYIQYPRSVIERYQTVIKKYHFHAVD